MIKHLYNIIKSFLFGIASLSINSFLIIILLAFVLLKNHILRDNIVKNHVLPALKQFNIPQFTYDTAFINNHAFSINNIQIYDDTKQKFAYINHISITPQDFFDVFKGIVKIDIDTVIIFKKPIFLNKKQSNQNPFDIPKIPVDIDNFNINKIILKPAVTHNPKDVYLNIKARHSLKNNLIAFDILAFVDNQSKKNYLSITGDVHNSTLKATLNAKQFNAVDIYPVSKDLQKLILNGALKLQGNLKDIKKIPNIDGTMTLDALYHHVPLNSEMKGKYLDNESTIDFKLYYNNNDIITGNLFFDNKQTGKLDIVVNTKNIPDNIADNIPIIADNIHIATDFNVKNKHITFVNGHFTAPILTFKDNLVTVPTELTDIKLDFSNTPNSLIIKNAHFAAIINQHIYDTDFNADFYDYYKPKMLFLKMIKHDTPEHQALLTLKHKDKRDIIDIDIKNLNVNSIFDDKIPLEISDFSSHFHGTMDLFAYNISQTLNGTLKAQANHTIENDNKASILMNGTVNNGAINADYLLFLNDTQTGTGHIVGNNDLSHFQTTTNSDLKVINIFIQNTPHRIAGKVIANIDLKNNVITGDLQVKNGAYNNVYYNSVIDTIDIQAKLTPNFIDVTHLNAMTNPTGTMTAQGIISMSPTVQSSLVIKTNDFMPVKNDMVSMNVNSNLNLTGSFNNLKLLGNINIDDLLILLPDLQSNETPHLNIIRKPKNETPIIATESVPLLERIQTDILVKITQGAKITGFGVQGFPFGTLNIVGNMGNPQINGQVDIARGKIEFFGKNFKITKGGIAMKANNPLFNVAAEYKIDKTTINLSLKGTVQNPDVVLSSTPQIPKDEIVALLIFGRGKKELSPFQALQLANTVYQLSRGKSGAGSTFDIVGKTERLLNIDELNINSGDNNSVNIGAGKYISEDIYIATEYNPITANNIFRLELKLTDSIDIISRLNRTNKVNNTNNSEIMLIKSKDY